MNYVIDLQMHKIMNLLSQANLKKKYCKLFPYLLINYFFQRPKKKHSKHKNLKTECFYANLAIYIGL